MKRKIKQFVLHSGNTVNVDGKATSSLALQTEEVRRAKTEMHLDEIGIWISFEFTHGKRKGQQEEIFVPMSCVKYVILEAEETKKSK